MCVRLKKGMKKQGEKALKAPETGWRQSYQKNVFLSFVIVFLCCCSDMFFFIIYEKKCVWHILCCFSSFLLMKNQFFCSPFCVWRKFEYVKKCSKINKSAAAKCWTEIWEIYWSFAEKNLNAFSLLSSGH